MSDLPSVSLIVLNWNGRGHLAMCLGSLATLDYPREKLEIILCDNGSMDGSPDYVRREFPTVRLITLDRNYGFAEGNNQAAAQSRGEWVGFLNNDMRVGPSWLRDLLSPLQELPDLVCLSSRIVNWDGSAIDFIGGGINFQGHGFQIDQGLPKSSRDRARRVLFACGGAMLIRRQIFQELGGFDRDYFAFFEDVDLGWRLNLLGYDVWYTPRATVYHRHHGTAEKLEARKLLVLYERNALYTIYKCFDDDNLAAALAASMLLLNERALLVAGIDRRPFQLAPVRDETEQPKQEGLLGKVKRVSREQGYRVLVRKSFAYARTRVGSGIRLQLLGLVGQGTLLPSVSISHYIALSEFGHSLEALTAKRRWLQERRVRSDAEILRLFEDPFYPNSKTEPYLSFYRLLCRVLELDKRFRLLPNDQPDLRRQ